MIESILNELSPTELMHADQICLRFEEAWKAGENPRVEGYLKGVPDTEREYLLRELLLLEFEYRTHSGTQAEQARNAKNGQNMVATLDEVPSAKDSGPPANIDPSLPKLRDYEILGLLGRGGMGVVYKARHLLLNRVVALKMIRVGSDAGPDAISRFKSEAAFVARLQHPNIVQIYEIGDYEGQPYFSLEFAEGGALSQRLGGNPQAPRESAKLIETLARAISVAHESGVIHRDLKPANILLAADGSPKVADFGLAKQQDSEPGQTRTGALLGTPSYMAPEQAEGKTNEIGPAADIYALGGL